MPRNRADENAVMYGVKQVCALYGVELLRMQSRVFTVPGRAGKDRPMFFGKWTDMKGQEHASGMADLLARPRVTLGYMFPEAQFVAAPELYKKLITVPLWIETKAGKENTSFEQLCFRQYVEANGEHWIQVKDSFDPLIEWFTKMGVSKAR